MNTLAELQAMVGQLVVLEKLVHARRAAETNSFTCIHLPSPVKETETLVDAWRYTDVVARSYTSMLSDGIPFVLLRAEPGPASVLFYGLHPETGFFLLDFYNLNDWKVVASPL